MKYDKQPLAFPVEYLVREDAQLNTSTMSSGTIGSGTGSRHTTPGGDVDMTRYGGEEAGNAGVDNMMVGGRLSGLGDKRGKSTPLGRYSEAGSGLGPGSGVRGSTSNMFEDNEFNNYDTLDVGRYDEQVDLELEYPQDQADDFQPQSNSTGTDVHSNLNEFQGETPETGENPGETGATGENDPENPFMAGNEPNYEDIYGGTAVDVSTSTYNSDYYSHQMSTRTAKVLDVMKVQLEENVSRDCVGYIMLVDLCIVLYCIL